MNTLIGLKTHFSIGESIVKPSEGLLVAKDNGYKTVALADTMSISALPDFVKAAKEQGLDYIVGCRLRVVDDPTYRPKKGEKPQPEVFPKVFVRNEDGFRDLVALLTEGYKEENFYYTARVSWKSFLATVSRKNLLVTTGDFGSVLAVDGHSKRLPELWRAAGVDNVYLEVVPANTPWWDRISSRAFAVKAKLPQCRLLASYPALYESREKADARDVMELVYKNDRIASPWRHINYLRDLYIHGPLTMHGRLGDLRDRLGEHHAQPIHGDLLNECLLGSDDLTARCEYRWSKMSISLPVMAEDEFATLKGLIVAGWKNRFDRPVLGHKPDGAAMQVYKDRLTYELSVLKRQSFERYFLIVHDLVAWAKGQGILVGPGRGSVGGSLIAYLIGITDVDPIRFGLLFERFINPDRIDLPDADLDFQSSRRQEVIDYLVNKYGSDRVAGISNFSTMASASALRDVGRIYDLDDGQLRCSKLVPTEHGSPVSLEDAAIQVPEIEAFASDNPVVWAHATSLQGVMRSMGRHAAGIVVGGEPLVNRAVVETRNGTPTVNWDKNTVEDFGLVKIDILGLSTLDVIGRAIKYIKAQRGVDLDLLRLPLDDSDTLDAFGKGDTGGVFQFESPGMRKLLRDLALGGKLSFDEITAATALYRPGPKDSGLLERFVSIKQGVSLPYYDHPNAEQALKETFGVIVYQEQVMQLARDLAGFTMTEADHMRKAMGKKDKEKMEKLRERWVAGCLSTSSMGSEEAEALFEKILNFAAYGFNKSHAVEYSVLSFWTMYLRVHYAAEFFAAALGIVDEEKVPGLVADARKRGIEIVPPDINLSSGEWTIALGEPTLLYAPFSACKGLSDSTSNVIMEARAKVTRFESKEHFIASVNRTKCNKRHQEVLEKVGAFAAITPGALQARHPDRLKDQTELMPGYIIDLVKADRTIESGEFVRLKLRDEVLTQLEKCIGCSLSGGVHPSPRLGKKPKFMVIFDCPNWKDEESGQLLSGDTADFIKWAIKDAGLSVQDAYFTALVKSPKSEKMLTNEQINGCSVWLKKELEIFNPPVIVALGGATIRHLVPGIKGGADDLAGRVVYDSKRGASIVCGFNPASIVYDGRKQEVLNGIFKTVADLVS